MKSDSFHQMSVCCNNLCVLPSDWACNPPPPPQLVSEPDPEKIEIEGLVDGVGGSVHCGMLGILLIVEPSIASRAL